MDNELLYQEVREANRVVRETEATDKMKAEAGTKLLVDAVAEIMELCRMARKEGLLALEEVADKMDKNGEYGYLRQLLFLIVDGTEPEIVEQSGTLMYYADDVRGYEALQYHIFLYGSLAMQQGMNPRIIEEQLLSMLTKSVRKAYKDGEEERKKATKAAEKAEDETADMTLVEKYSVGESPVKPGDEAYYGTQLLDYLIVKGLKDIEVQCVLGYIGDYDLVYVMKAVSGEARSKVFKNLSKRQAARVAEDLEYLGFTLLEDVVKAEHKMIKAVMELQRAAIIHVANGDLADAFSRVLSIPIDKMEEDKDMKKAERDLRKLIGEYMSDKKMI